jgi:hypothetical protein
MPPHRSTRLPRAHCVNRPRFLAAGVRDLKGAARFNLHCNLNYRVGYAG